MSLMDAVLNPYVPNAGAMPPALPGRETLVETFRVALARVSAGRTAKSILPYGLRGVGKTVLLQNFQDQARQAGALTALIEADEKYRFVADLADKLRPILYQLDTTAHVNALAKRAIRVFKSFTVKAGLEGLSMSMGVDAERGFGDSGNIASDLTTLLVAIGEAARDQGVAVLVAVDELQYLQATEFEALIRAAHRLTQERLPLIIVATGLPQVLQLAGEAKSYAERLFEFSPIGPLTDEQATQALVAPAKDQGVVFEEDAVSAIIRATRGYPFFLQEWAYNAWNVASGKSITLADAERGESIALSKLDSGFFVVRYDRCTPNEKRYLRAMAELGAGPHRTADVAKILDKKPALVGPNRDTLIKKGMIWSPDHGSIAFSVPLFDEFMIRKEPRFT